MKLLFCPLCGDVRKIRRRPGVACDCGKSSALYDAAGVSVTITGDAIVFGLHNADVEEAARGDQAEQYTLRAWRFRAGHPRVRRG